MKKLEKLTLKELGESSRVIPFEEKLGMKGGGQKDPDPMYSTQNGTTVVSFDNGITWSALLDTVNCTYRMVVHENCSLCKQFENSNTYGVMSQYPAALQFQYLIHDLTNWHNRYTTYDTTYVKVY